MSMLPSYAYIGLLGSTAFAYSYWSFSEKLICHRNKIPIGHYTTKNLNFVIWFQ